MTDPDSPTPSPGSTVEGAQLSPALLDERERVVQALATGYAEDRISLDEFEARLDRAYRSTSADQLAALLADMPAGVPAIGPTVRPAAARPAAEAAAGAMPGPMPHRYEITADAPERGFAWAVMGGIERKGNWTLPRELKVRVLMGGAMLDLREARFAPGVTDIDVFALMGGVQVLVPPGVRVECSGAALMGGFSADTRDLASAPPGQPVVRLTGLAVWGGVEAQVRLPGETEKAYRKRRRQERRLLGR
ncbi:MAG TPA: DUF1707 domain-containing protein [Gemmatimonadaceae bacterium]|nr:DUF1707 domain-containing protein [Gemmatimonadaceae bacterium]